jgi:hypothetical protein
MTGIIHDAEWGRILAEDQYHDDIVGLHVGYTESDLGGCIIPDAYCQGHHWG